MFDQALELHRAGKLTAAAALYRRILTAEPHNADALHRLGLIAHQSGRHGEAAELIRQAITRRPAASYWYNLAHVHLALKDTAQAKHALEQAIETEPGYVEALFHLGTLHSQADDLTEAAKHFRRAVAARPRFVEAHVNLGLLLNRMGDAEGAIGHLEHALRLRPDDPAIHNAIGTVRRHQSPSRAIENFQRALSLDPEHFGAKVNLAKSLALRGRHGEAVQALNSVLDRQPEDTNARMVLASSLAALGQFDEAIQQYELAAATMPRQLQPLDALRKLYLRLGKFEEAYLSCVKIRELEPQNCHALVGILRHLKARVSEQDAEQAARLAEGTALPIPERRKLHFALSSYKEAMGDYEAAFFHMDRGNYLRRMELEPLKGPYDVKKLADRVNRIIEVFDEQYFRRVRGFGVTSNLPVFVVGMPRSGTTLCEQILASHSKVFGAGELPDISRIERELMRQGGGHDAGTDDLDYGYARRLTSELVRSKAEGYVQRLRSLAPKASRIVDKMTMNYSNLGLIATLFPKGTIVHCRRDPLDTGLSCYSQDFANSLLWASDLRSIGQVYRQYERLMEHWRRTLPIDIFEFRYEDVVCDFERWGRALIGHCGLEWEDACLKFYETQRSVKTASLEQVRRPIYATSIGRWRKFERHLSPLREALNRT